MREFEYIGKNVCNRFIFRGQTVNLETINDAQVRKLINREPDFARYFRKKTKPKKQQKDSSSI